MDQDRKYEYFFNILKNKKINYNIENDVVVINDNELYFNNEDIILEKYYFPNIQATKIYIDINIESKYALIFNKLIVKSLFITIHNSTNIKFNTPFLCKINKMYLYSNSLGNNISKKNNNIIIPLNLNVASLKITGNRNHIKKIEDNKYLLAINIENSMPIKLGIFEKLKRISINNSSNKRKLTYTPLLNNSSNDFEMSFRIEKSNSLESISIFYAELSLKSPDLRSLKSLFLHKGLLKLKGKNVYIKKKYNKNLKTVNLDNFIFNSLKILTLDSINLSFSNMYKYLENFTDLTCINVISDDIYTLPINDYNNIKNYREKIVDKY